MIVTNYKTGDVMTLSEEEMKIEKAYRSGFSHGYHTALSNDNLSKEVIAWEKKQYEIREGAPGTFLEGVKMNG